MSARYPKGICVLAEDMARLIESKGHTVYFLSWPLSHRKPCLVTGEWRRDRVTIINTFQRTTVKIDDATIVGWVKCNELDVVLTLEEPNNINTFKICKELGVPTINYVDIERFNPDLKSYYDDCSLFFCPTQQCYDTLFEYGMQNIMLVRYIANIHKFPWQLRKVKGPVEFVMHAGWTGTDGRKGVEPTIEAFVQAKHPNAKLTVITQKRWKTYDDKIKNLTASNKNIRISEINNTSSVYNTAAYSIGHVVIQPSRWEGLGLTYIEALISGLPAIATNAPPMCEFIEHEKTGLLVDADIVPGKKISSNLRIQAALVKIDALAESISYLANNPSCIEYMSNETEKFREQYASYVESFMALFQRIERPLVCHA
jgi:hypothetical protein